MMNSNQISKTDIRNFMVGISTRDCAVYLDDMMASYNYIILVA